jgi:hypothetical protein
MTAAAHSICGVASAIPGRLPAGQLKLSEFAPGESVTRCSLLAVPLRTASSLRSVRLAAETARDAFITTPSGEQ